LLHQHDLQTEQILADHDRQTDQILADHDRQTDQILADREAKTKAMMARLEDDVRKITVNMGFNVLILPTGQRLTDLYDEEKTPQYMPEEYAATLAKSRVATVNHVLPSLTQRIKWPERQRKIMLMGVRGEVYLHSKNQQPILEAVTPGQMVVGYELHRSMNLAAGQKVQLMKREFTISKLLEERGTWDDATVWIDLHQAQEMLAQSGKINAILALECDCATNRLSNIREEIGALLPNTQVIEFASQALARAEARNRAAAQAVASLEQEKVHRAQVREEQKAQRTRVRGEELNQRNQVRSEFEAFAAILLPVVLLTAGLWTALLALVNVRERRPEIAILRALGLRTRQILLLFLGRAVVLGLAGGCLGLAGGILIALLLGRTTAAALGPVLNPWLVAAVLAGAPLLTVLASWIPAFLAVGQDPAVALQQE
jgi:ABC-type lipoprotein release transport system permease subunit